ncbi:MAG: hypothetical protein Q9213_006981 [Squamulea squamosa]
MNQPPAEASQGLPPKQLFHTTHFTYGWYSFPPGLINTALDQTGRMADNETYVRFKRVVNALGKLYAQVEARKQAVASTDASSKWKDKWQQELSRLSNRTMTWFLEHEKIHAEIVQAWRDL